MRAAAVVVAAICLAEGVAHAGAFEVRDETWEGCSQLLELAREELGTGRVVPWADLNWSDLEPTDGVLILHPERAITHEKLSSFLQAGGRVAILDDYGASDRTLEPMLVQKVPAPTHPAEALRNNPALSIAEPVVAHPAVAGVERLVTNHPTALYGPKLTPVLRIRSADGPDSVLAYAAEPQKSIAGGKLFLMGDPSVLINQMLRYPGNRAFAVGLVRFLARQSEGGTGKLYVVTNDFGQTGTFGNADLFADIASGVESVRSAAALQLEDGFAGPLGWALGAALALLLAGFTVTSCLGARRTRTPAFARRPSLLAQGGAAGRAALLAAPESPGSLLLLELKNALEEGVAQRLGLGERPGMTTLEQAACSSCALDESSQQAFKGVLYQMARAETFILSRRPQRVKKADLARAARWVENVLAAGERTVR